MPWFWYFLIYSFIGFLLEVAFALCTGGHPRRKCLLILPLCPVYGMGACAIVLVSEWISHPLGLFLWGSLLATLCEYIMAVFYEEALGVQFWSYDRLPFHLHGRVCLPFSLAWGGLSIPLVRWLHPMVCAAPFSPPPLMTLTLLCAFLGDFLVSALLLRQAKTRDVLDWYLK